jgi:hypothetical protein
LNLFEGGAVFAYHERPGGHRPFWGLAEPAWQRGEILILRDEKGQEQARYKVP